MTDAEAKTILSRYTALWDGGPSPVEIRRAIADFDYTAMTNVLDTLARTQSHAPKIAELIGVYRQQTPDRHEPPDYSNAINPKLGKRIAYQTYHETCVMLGKQPKRDWFNHLMGHIDRAEE